MNRQGYFYRFLRLMLGLFLCGTGSYLQIQANIGLAPWEALNMGASYVLHILYGNAGVIVGVIIIVLDVLLREKIGFGTILNAVIYVKWVDFWNYIGLLPKMQSLLTGIPTLFCGQVLISLGTWLYISCAMGAGPRDTLMLGLGRKFPGLPIGVVRGSLEAMALALGWLMGAKVGIGTLIAVLSIGFVMQGVFTLVRFEPRNVRHENCLDTVNLLKHAESK